jgi:hypothetical protein
MADPLIGQGTEESTAAYDDVLTEGKDVEWPDMAKAQGDVQDRAISYMVALWAIVDDIDQGTSIATPEMIAEFASAWYRDPEAIKHIKEKSDIPFLEIEEVANAAIQQGRRDIVLPLINISSSEGQIREDPYSNAAVMIASGSAVNFGFNVARAGSIFGWNALLSGGIRESSRNILLGASVARLTSKSFTAFPAVIRAIGIKAPLISEEVAVYAALKGINLTAAYRTARILHHLRTATGGVAITTAAASPFTMAASAWSNAVNAAENDAGDLDAIMMAELDRQLMAAANELANVPMPEAAFDLDRVNAVRAGSPDSFNQALGQSSQRPLNYEREQTIDYGVGGAGSRVQAPTDNPTALPAGQWQGPPANPAGIYNAAENGVVIVDGNGEPYTFTLDGTMTEEEMNEQLIPALVQAGVVGEKADNQVIGVPLEGHTAYPSSILTEYDEIRGDDRSDIGELAEQNLRKRHQRETGVTAVKAEYRYGHIKDVIWDMTPAQVASFQTRGIEAGLIDPDKPGFLLGIPDDATQFAMETAMHVANNSGRDWKGSIDVLAAAWQTHLLELANEEISKPIYQPNPYRAIDTAYTSQVVKDQIRSALGREPNAAELNSMQDYISSQHKAAYTESERVNRADFAASGRMIEEETEQDAIMGVDVDWQARFAEEFERKYEDEITRKGRTELVDSKRGDLRQSFSVGQNL